MNRLALLPLVFAASTADARKKRGSDVVVAKVPSIEQVVREEGFEPTLSQSDIYRPGSVLVPNSRGGHDKVVADCVGVEPEVSYMSQSSIATSLSAGVSARLTAVRGEVAAGVEKRLSFVDPEQRTIPLAQLMATDACAAGLENAARFTDLTQAVLVYDVLVAQIQNTVCTKADASGGVTLLGETEAAAYSECVQESDAQVPLGFKGVPLTQVVTLEAPASSPVQAPVIPRQPTAVGAEWTGSSGYAMVSIAAGSFTMGSPSSEENRVEDDETQHRVTLTKGFLMGKTEVTQGLWRSVMGSNPSIETHDGVSLVGERLPVQNVSWCDAVSFANKLSARDGLSKAYAGVEQCETSKSTSVVWDRSSDGYRLPTEAEWEYAARAGKLGPYAGGVTADTVCRVANVADISAPPRFDWKPFSCDDGAVGPAHVGRYEANPWGLFDMTGNVNEWCWDWWAPYETVSTDPVGPGSGSSRLFRGGSWTFDLLDARVAGRFSMPANHRGEVTGVRLARRSP